METWHIWIIIAVLLFIVEIFAPVFLAACLAIGCITSGLFSYFDYGLKIQLIAFSVGTLASFFGVRPFILKYAHKKSNKVKTNTEALIGKVGRVKVTIDNSKNQGRVMVEGDDWRAETKNSEIINEGERVELQDINPPKEIRDAMEKQMRAERDKRAKILEAEGDKVSQVLKSEGLKEAAVNNAEGEKQSKILRAEGDAQARIRTAQGEAEAIQKVTQAIVSAKSDPMNYLIAVRYIDTLKEMVREKDNKMIYIPYEATGILSSIGGIKDLFNKTTK
jgi:membrane protein implicated in regulation of membrane protease activity